MSFAHSNAHSGLLFFENKILKFPDNVSIEIVFLLKIVLSTMLSPFYSCQRFILTVPEMSQKKLLFVAKHNTKCFGNNSIINLSTLTWNIYQSMFHERDLMSLPIKILKSVLSNYLFSTYMNQ